jgi:hypothetical protein
MGIRFYCPQGHKLNVKSFLAGKTGVCPHCDARVKIPFTSTRPSSKAINQRVEGRQEALPLASPLEDVDQVLAVAEIVNDDAGSAATVENQPADKTVAPTPSTPSTTSPPTIPPGNAAEPLPAAVNDPLLESPDAQWYVCPEAGGQRYGPAHAAVMRQWLEEGRVLPDSLVWREGWPNWQRAGDCFLHLDQRQAGQN